MKILVVEDDRKIASFIAKGLQQAGFVVDHAADGEEGLDRLLNETYDLAIIDIMLPKRDGLELVAELRRINSTTAAIILSAKRSVDDRVRGLQAGGDDYLTKPFAFAELLARVQALLRRTARAPEIGPLVCCDLSLDIVKREATRGGCQLELQPREFSLLHYLLRNAGRVVSKTMILEQVYDYNFDPQTNVVDVLVCRLRGKVDRDFEPKLVHTIRGVGYVLKES